MSDTPGGVRATTTPVPKQWTYWLVLAAAALGPLYVLLLPILVG